MISLKFLNFLAPLQRAFAKFDLAGTGLVSTKVLGELLRHLNFNPTKAELQVNLIPKKSQTLIALQDLTIQIDPHVTGYIKLPDLLDIMSRIVQERSSEGQLTDAFK